MILICAALALSCSEGAPAEHVGFAEQDALSYVVDLEVDVSNSTARVRVMYQFRAVEELSIIRLHGASAEDWRIRFEMDGEELVATETESGVLHVQLPDVAAKGQLVEFEALLSGTPPDGLYFGESRYQEPILFTDHFSSRARAWMPCEDHPSDRAAFSVTLSGIEDWEVIASGLDEDGDGTWETTTDLPTYMFAFAAGPYQRLVEEGDERFIPHFVYRRDKPKARLALKHHAEWMDTMEATFGPYAWEKYCVVQVPTRWGGMENAGITWLMERIFDGPTRGVGTLAHEFVHMWFGNAAGYGEWHEAWLSEGFATYFGPWLYETTGGPPLNRAMEGSRRRWLRSDAGKTRPIRWKNFSEPDEFFGSSAPNTYQKGAWVLHMLRTELGDEVFFAGVGEYYRSVQPGMAITSDLRRAMERASGRDLAWFFRQWLDAPDCPHLSVTWNADSVVVRQHQDNLYRFRLPLSWVNHEGQRVKHWVEVREAEMTFPIEGAYSAPVVDPDVELLYRVASDS